MTEEEYFRKNYPDSCYGDKPLSPHWDFFQDGVEFGERQSEKKITDLEKENAELKTEKIPQLERKIASIRGSHRVDIKKLNARIEQVERLKKENAELKELMHVLIANAPNTYSGTNIELQQKKMFSFQDAVNKAEQFLNSEVEK